MCRRCDHQNTLFAFVERTSLQSSSTTLYFQYKGVSFFLTLRAECFYIEIDRAATRSSFCPSQWSEQDAKTKT